jgi:hypothetical protein
MAQDSGLTAAFVAITVAGQQGNSPPSPFPVPILDFGLPILDSSKIQNLKSKIGRVREEGKSPLSLASGCKPIELSLLPPLVKF